MSKYENKNFYCIISFDEPRGGPTYQPAKDETEARELLIKQYGSLKNFVIHQIIDTTTIAPAVADPHAFDSDMIKKETLN